MKTVLASLPVLLVFSLAVSPGAAQDRKTKVLNDRSTFAKNEVWLYNDVDEAFAQAKKSGKPLLVVFRCVPCEACSHFDQQLLDEQESMRDLLDQFVCARVVKANGLDLNLFQFDYDQSFHAMFLNADKTIYGRFGTRSQRKEDEDMTLDGLRAAMKAVLALHKDYPKNKAALAGKSGSKVAHEVPEAMPGLHGKYKSEIDYEGNVVQSCIHCHQIRDSERAQYRSQDKELPEAVLFPYPLPDVIGLSLDPSECATVTKIAEGSIAGQTKLAPGDKLLTINSQSLVSIADLQWVLHNAPSEGKLRVTYERSGEVRQTELKLSKGWRAKSNLSWRPTTWDLRRMALGGLWLIDLNDEERTKRGLGNEGMALWAKHVGEYGEHAVAKNAGFRKDDVLVSVGKESGRLSETDLIAMALKHSRGEKLPVTVLRGKERIQLTLTLP
jgi:serine protease Do